MNGRPLSLNSPVRPADLAATGDAAPRGIFTVGKLCRLVDPTNKVLGEVALESVRDGRWDGRFRESPSFAIVKTLFDERLELINNQVFSLLDDIETRIAALGLRLESVHGEPMPAIHDLDIGCGLISFCVTNETS